MWKSHSAKQSKHPPGTFRLTYQWPEATLVTLNYLAIIIIVACAVAFGASDFVLGLDSFVVLGEDIDTDLQLALIGFVNKIFDFLAQTALQNIALVVVTVWMISADKQGANGHDFDLFKELVNPYKATAGFVNRCRAFGWRGVGWSGTSRFVASLVISICVILSAVGLNTIGVPKRRWLPDSNFDAGNPHLTVYSPLKVMRGLDWMNIWHQSWQTIGSGPASWTAMGGLTAAEAILTWSSFGALYRAQPLGWQNMYELTMPDADANSIVVTGIDTTPGSSTQTVSLRHVDLRSIYDNRLNLTNAPPWVAKARGLTGYFNITMPMLSTSCQPSADGAGDDDAPIVLNTGNNVDKIAFDVRIHPVSNINFTGASCSVMFNQALFNTSGWVLTSPTSISFNNYGQDYKHVPVVLPRTSGDADIVNGLVGQFNAIRPLIDGLFPNLGTAGMLVLAARNIRTIRPDIFESEAAALSPIVGATLQNFFTIANWNISTATPDDDLSSMEAQHSKVQWLVYGAGPRLKWEWISIIPLIVVGTTAVLGLVQVFWHRIKPAPWLETHGMAITANTSPEFDIIASLGRGKDAEEEVKKKTLWARDVDRQVIITEYISQAKPPKSSEDYRIGYPALARARRLTPS